MCNWQTCAHTHTHTHTHSRAHTHTHTTLNVHQVSEFYEVVETKRVARLNAIVQSYQSIGVTMRKVEEVVAGTVDGSSPILASYYTYWEKRILNAITQMIITSMATFLAILKDKESEPFIQVTDTSCTCTKTRVCERWMGIQNHFIRGHTHSDARARIHPLTLMRICAPRSRLH